MAIGENSLLVILESPYAGLGVSSQGDIEANVHYARMAIRDSLLRGEAPFASHLLYTQDGILDDTVEIEREHGINAGLSWGSVAQKTVVYIDKGISRGMKYGIEKAKKEGRPIEFRSLPEFAQKDGLTIKSCEMTYC